MALVQILRNFQGGELPHPRVQFWKAKRFLTRVIFLLLGLSLAGLTSCSVIGEQLNLSPQAPSADVKRLAQSTTMTPLAERLFYRQDPKLEPPQLFWEQCKVPHGNIVLGCYIEEPGGWRGKQSRIVIQNVIDPRFSGTMEVTAAHEMLHAAYARLSPVEQEDLYQQLHVARERVTDQPLLKLLQDYQAQSKERYAHELYAHLGTELKDLGNPALEEHYKQFFGDRQQIVAFAEQSGQAVAKLDKQADVLEVEIDKLEQQLIKAKQSLEKAEGRLNILSASLEEQQSKVQQTQASVQSASTKTKAQHLAAKVKREQLALNRKIENYNRQVKQQKKSIVRFNLLVEDYGKKVETYNQLAWRRWKTMEGLSSQSITSRR